MGPRTGLDGRGKSHPTGIRFPDRPARSESLYQLSSPGPCNITYQARINPYPTAFPYGNGMVLHFYQQQESSTTKTVHKVINKGLKGYV